MQNLIKITTVPINFELKINPAKLQTPTELPKVDISRSKGNLVIKSDPIKVNIDTFEARKSMGLESAASSTQQYAQDGIRIAYQATAQMVQEGNALADIQNGGDTIPRLAMERMNRNVDTMLEFLPSVAPNISWQGGTLSMEYQADQLDFDWQIEQPSFEFIPGKIEFMVNELPKVIIEYLGDPIYVPPTANPNFKPVFNPLDKGGEQEEA